MKPPTDETRERLVIYAPPKTGKTTAAYSIAGLLKKGASDATVWWLDNDNGLADVDDPYDNIEATVINPVDWTEYVDFTQHVVSNAKHNDWVVVDLWDNAWRAVRAFYTEQVQGKTVGEKLVEGVQKGLSGWDLHKDTNWEIVYSWLDEFAQPLLTPRPGAPRLHLCFLCGERALGPDDTTLKRMFPHGTKPGGTPRTSYEAKTIVYLEWLARGRMFSTWEKMGRDNVSKEEFSNFAMSYLVGHVGWEL